MLDQPGLASAIAGPCMTPGGRGYGEVLLPYSYDRTEAEFCIEQARAQLRLAELSDLPARIKIHATAADRWIRLAERAKRLEKRLTTS